MIWPVKCYSQFPKSQFYHTTGNFRPTIPTYFIQEHLMIVSLFNSFCLTGRVIKMWSSHCSSSNNSTKLKRASKQRWQNWNPSSSECYFVTFVQHVKNIFREVVIFEAERETEEAKLNVPITCLHWLSQECNYLKWTRHTSSHACFGFAAWLGWGLGRKHQSVSCYAVPHSLKSYWHVWQHTSPPHRHPSNQSFQCFWGEKKAELNVVHVKIWW